jgi:predicted RNase H-like HicB family nuclease
MTANVQMKIEINLRAAVGFDSQAGVWVSWCPALDIYSQGESKSEARLALNEALTSYVKYCYKSQILDNVLVKRGFQVSPDSQVATDGDEYIDVQKLDHGQFSHTFDLTVQVPLTSAMAA